MRSISDWRPTNTSFGFVDLPFDLRDAMPRYLGYKRNNTEQADPSATWNCYISEGPGARLVARSNYCCRCWETFEHDTNSAADG